MLIKGLEWNPSPFLSIEIMQKKTVKVGNIVEVFNDDGESKIARVLNISFRNEEVVVMYLDELLNDLYIDTVSLLNCKIYEKRCND